MLGVQNHSLSGGAFCVPHNPIQTITKREPEKTALFLVGPPCGGKGVAAKVLGPLGACVYSSSAALMEYANRYNKSEIIEAMNNGDLVPHHEVALVSGWHYTDFIHHRNFGVFDGWLRTVEEAKEALTPRFLKESNILILFLDATDESLLARARNRKRCDDALIQKRIGGYRTHAPLLKGYLEGLEHRIENPRIFVETIDTTSLGEDEVGQAVRSLAWR